MDGGITAQKQEMLILGLTPEILGKPVLWYSQNAHRIKESLEASGAWQKNAALVTKHARASLPELLRRLDELGYEKVLRVTRYGEFAHRGGAVDVFPLNENKAMRIEFIGNTIDEIRELDTTSDIAREDWEKIIGRSLEVQQKEFQEGELVVHLDHGIGRYAGKRTLNIQNESREPRTRAWHGTGQEYFVVEYAKGDRLFVPTNLSRKLSRYLGFSQPTIARLGGTLWLKTKRRVREDALALARQLFDLYAAKEAAARPPYHPDPLEETFADSFPFSETPDQLRAVREIAADLSREKPMDRLVCGDVGFGKTEVALRAILRVVLNGAQAALLAPTTILADQHFTTAQQRFEKFGVNAMLLTRLRTPSAQRKVLNGLADGSIDLVIGTHRILSRDVVFKNLRLLVIDEEQRFGVKTKEALRETRAHLDVLSLSATPIPRTFYFSLAGLRPISRIQTPPPGRQAIATTVAPWSDALVRTAIRKELARRGQIYFLHNRITTMRDTLRAVQRFAPHARIAALHGRMNEKLLVETMERLRNRELDILVATTIIENGLDLPHVNTLIVEDSSRLGLAQAYQLRGRIGRSHEKGYAYFLWKGKHISPKGLMRLAALKAAEELGSGWRIAERDLEIRGAGNILGREQSGNVNRVGLNLYCQMLSEAVEQLKQHAAVLN